MLRAQFSRAATRMLQCTHFKLSPACIARHTVRQGLMPLTRGLKTITSQGFVRPIQSAATDSVEKPEMFCYQCEQTKLRKGCTVIGVCGKTPETAALQDLLVYALRGMALYGDAILKIEGSLHSKVYNFTFGALFSTLTNVNFDSKRFPEYIEKALKYRDELKAKYEEICSTANVEPKVFSHDEASWSASREQLESIPGLVEKGHQEGVLKDQRIFGPDVAGVRQMIIYGLKGMATYARHAQLLGQSDDSVGEFTLSALAWLANGPMEERTDLATNLSWALKVGEINLKGLQMLDNGHRMKFGIPTPAQVQASPVPGKCILVSGHDMFDLAKVLEATQGTGINVYTHGEMLPAHGYPELKKYDHLVGQFGTAWQFQKYEFSGFPGPILVTTNCLTEPRKSYKDRIFTVNDVGWPDCQHLELPRDLDILIEAAENCEGFTEEDCERKANVHLDFSTGHGREFILSNAEEILGAVNTGNLKRIFLIGGCDGSENKRSYYTTLARALPEETLMLTLGCAKYRINNSDYGYVPGTEIPRLLDMGQCNDAYGAVVVAQTLADVLNTDINSLPLSITLSWFEQKAVAVLLSLLHLGVQNIRLGPILPGFLTPTVLDILVDKFNIVPAHMRNPVDDMNVMLGKKEA